MRSVKEIAKVRKEVAADGSGLSKIFRALSDENRLTIVRVFLEKHNLCVSELANLLHVSVPAASAHLKILEAAGVVARNRAGQNVCYSISSDNKTLQTLLKVIKDNK